jgi:hypothetical protein
LSLATSESHRYEKYLFLYVIRPLLGALLWSLDKLYQATRKKGEVKYPYDKHTGAISLPEHLEDEVRQIAVQEGKPKAIKKVTELTGAGL